MLNGCTCPPDIQPVAERIITKKIRRLDHPPDRILKSSSTPSLIPHRFLSPLYSSPSWKEKETYNKTLLRFFTFHWSFFLFKDFSPSFMSLLISFYLCVCRDGTCTCILRLTVNIYWKITVTKFFISLKKYKSKYVSFLMFLNLAIESLLVDISSWKKDKSKNTFCLRTQINSFFTSFVNTIYSIHTLHLQHIALIPIKITSITIRIMHVLFCSYTFTSGNSLSHAWSLWEVQVHVPTEHACQRAGAGSTWST